MTFCVNEQASRLEPKPRPSTRRGFTLVEILVVIVILGVMGGMVVTAVNGVTRSARHARTKMIISAVDGVIQEQYDSYKYRPFPIVLPNFSRTTTGTPPVTLNYEVLAYEAARVRLIMTRDSQRMELPDKKLDVVTAGGTIQGPIGITAVANQIAENSDGKVLRYFNDSSNPRWQFPVTWSPARKVKTYYDRYQANVSAGNTWTAQNEGAECLYLIMATSFVAGTGCSKFLTAGDNRFCSFVGPPITPIRPQGCKPRFPMNLIRFVRTLVTPSPAKQLPIRFAR